jgi:lipoprotein
MKKYLFLFMISLVLLSGCGKKTENTPAQVVQITKEQTLGKWTNDSEEIYEFKKGYKFDGEIIINGIKEQVSGDYNLVNDEASDTTSLTINTEKIRVSYIVDGIKEKSKLVLKNPDTGKIEKELKFVG